MASPDRSARIESLYLAALALPFDSRVEFLLRECSDDPGLLAELELLLARAPDSGDLPYTSSPRAGAAVASQSLQIDDAIGSYVVSGPIGAGGMGEVYKAFDSKLRRYVALKVLPRAVADDHDRLARLEREARMLAALNHPNIAQIYGLEDAKGTRTLVMELVDGETLSARIDRGPLPVADSISIALQICDALEAAHDRGIVHRDLKPSNVTVRPDGVVKVLDFGLAKPVSGAGFGAELAQAATVTGDGTRDGVVLGSAAYMSPEQARGRAIDKRTDIWAFGCVLFEMLSGSMPFGRPTASDTVAAVLEHEPRWEALPPATPRRLRDLLRRCLEKDTRSRMRDIGDVRLELSDALASPWQSAPALEPVAVPRASRWRTALAIGGVVAAGAFGYALALYERAGPLPHQVRRFDVPLPATQRLTGLDFPSVAMAPDGSLIAYVATRGGRAQLFVRPLSSIDPMPIGGTADAISPFFSPDGRWVAFFADGKLKKVLVSGGSPITICDAAIGFGGAWGPGDRIIFSPATGAGLMQVAAGGGKPSRVTTLDASSGEFSHRWPELLPDGETVLFTVGTVGSWDDAQIVTQSLRTGRRTVVVQGGTNPHYVSSGYIVYAHGGALIAVPFDVKSLKVSGQPFRVLDSVVESPDGAAQVAIARSGDAVYVPSGASTERRLLSVDRSGTAAAFAAPPRAYSTPRLSPDGHRLVVTISGANDDLWVYESATGSLQQLTFDSDAAAPIWAPDGRVTFTWSKDGPPNLFSIPLGQASREERLASSDYRQTAGSWSPDGRTLAYVESQPATGRDIWLLPLDGDRKPISFRATTFDETDPKFSPDGRWLAFVSNESGRNEVYLSPTDNPARAPVQISHEGGTEPVWAGGTRELIYRSGNRVMSVQQTGTGGDWSKAEPRLLFERPFEIGNIDVANYDVTPDGQHFILIETAHGDASSAALRVVLDWADSIAATPR